MKKTVFLSLLVIILAFGLIGCDNLNEDCTVTFDLDGGKIGNDTSSVKITVKSGETIANFPQNPQKENNLFGGWFNNKNGLGNEFTTTSVVTSNMTVYAKWTSNGSNNTPPPSVIGVQLYTLSGTTFSEYSGTGSEQEITGGVRELGGSSSTPNTIGKIGTISGNGKLNLQLPTTVNDEKLFDATTGGESYKIGGLVTSPSISLYDNDGEYYGITYINKDTTSPDGQSLKKGWFYTNQVVFPTDISNYKWVIDNP